MLDYDGGGRPPAQIYSPHWCKWHKTSTQNERNTRKSATVFTLWYFVWFAANAIIQLWAVSGKKCTEHFLLYAPVWNMKDTNGFYYFWSIWLLKWARLSCLLILLFAYRNAFQVKRFSFCSTRWPEPILRFFSLANTCVRSVQLNRVMRFCRIRIENKSIAYRYRWQCVFVRFCYCSNNRRFHTKQYNCRALKCSLLPRFQVNWIARNWIWNVSREVLSVAWIIFDYVIQMLFRCCYCQFRCQNQWQNIKIHVFARPTFWSTIRHSIW